MISNDGSFCPNGYSCVSCNSGSNDICCRGADNVVIPPYLTYGTGTPIIPAAPSTHAAPTTKAAVTSTAVTNTAVTDTAVTNTAVSQTTESSQAISISVFETGAAGQTTNFIYATTTFTYSFIVWSTVPVLENIVSTTSTTYTILSCSAIDEVAASATLSSMASQVQETASISAQYASPISSAVSLTASQTSPFSVAPAATGGSGLKSDASPGIGRPWVWGRSAAVAGVLVVILAM